MDEHYKKSLLVYSVLLYFGVFQQFRDLHPLAQMNTIHRHVHRKFAKQLSFLSPCARACAAQIPHSASVFKTDDTSNSSGSEEGLQPSLIKSFESLAMKITLMCDNSTKLVFHKTGHPISSRKLKTHRDFSSLGAGLLSEILTAERSILEGNLPIRIEPLLFEWLGWYSGKLPNFLSPTALYELGCNVDTTYSSLSSVDQLDLQETVAQFYARSTQIVKEILDCNPVK
ncbi:hypothetical protein ACTXT7_011613, partial [Hymenolepis weldensis]